MTVTLTSGPSKWAEEEKRKEALAHERELKSQHLLWTKSFAMFDIETTNLNASIGEILAACVKQLGQDEVKVFKAGRDDKKLVRDVAQELKKYDYICTYNGTRFDLPFISTRLLVHGQPSLGTLRHIDLYFTARTFLRLHSNRLQVVAETLFGTSTKTQVLGNIWNRAQKGDRKSLNYIVEHCIEDVKELERVFCALVPFRSLGATPLRLY